MNLRLNEPKLAMVVDDSATQCRVLSVLLEEEGYRAITANDGASGVAMYIEHQPDLVIMDINMPVMDGYEATRRIKRLSNDNLAPLIFVTSMNSDQSFIESIDAGGDGILVRPFSPEVFKAKIKSIQRISDLYAQVKQLQQEQQNDAELAEKLMADVIESRNYGIDKIRSIKKPATLFSGDIQLSAMSPNGNVYIMLGDFTGHGLRASIGAIPLAETFRTMTSKGFSILEIVEQINQQLYRLLPPDLFLAAAFASISTLDDSLYLFNAGLPDVYLFGGQGQVKEKIPSFHPPMGVLPNLLSDAKLVIKSIRPDDRLVIISDGIVEARNKQGEMFGFEHFEQAAKRGILKNNLVKSVLNNLEHFCANTPQDDDISLIDIPLNCWESAEDINTTSAQNIYDSVDLNENNRKPTWSWNMSLTGDRLAKINPIPMAMHQLHAIEGTGEQWQSLYTILTELYVNALDHGVLKLSSDLKCSPEGFVEYFNERERRLAQLSSGFVEINIQYYAFTGGGKVVVGVSDSGDGFDYTNFIKKRISENAELALSGRGIALVSQLCDTIKYDTKLRNVTATYIWLEE